MKEVVVIGAGLTGLTLTFLLKKQGKSVLLLEKENRVGGAIRTHVENGYVFEEGPNTGVVSNAEVVELFELLQFDFEIANQKAKKRLILKNNQWHALPCGLISFFRTPLFKISDKLKMMIEPFKKKGCDPDESVADLSARRIGQSFVDYAVNPFISGIYAGDPEHLVTRYALPKLYNLEQNYGSFIGGSFKKSREKKSERDLKVTRDVFSIKGGLESLMQVLRKQIGDDNIICNAKDITIQPVGEYNYSVNYKLNEVEQAVSTKTVVSTIGTYELSALLPFVLKQQMDLLTCMNYAKVVQVSVALKKGGLNPKYISFGGLIPKKENRNLLGVLFTSCCFYERAPQDCSTLAIYLGGIRHPHLFDLSDDKLKKLVVDELADLFEINENSILFVRIFRHPYAIPQYEKSSGQRFDTINKIEKEYKGLIVAGNLRDGIGMADRVKQAFSIAEQLQ